MFNITVMNRDGQVAQMEQVSIHGSKIQFPILTDILENVSMLKNMKNKKQGSEAVQGKRCVMGHGNILRK